jgi:hypothetical protein
MALNESIVRVIPRVKGSIDDEREEIFDPAYQQGFVLLVASSFEFVSDDNHRYFLEQGTHVSCDECCFQIALTISCILGGSTTYAFPNDAIRRLTNVHVVFDGKEIRWICNDDPIARCQCDQEDEKREHSESESYLHDLMFASNGCCRC